MSRARNRNPLLFQPLRFRALEVRNRIMLSPMCQYSAPDAAPHDWHLVHLGARAAGGAGIVMTEATAVEPIGHITPYDLGLWNDEQQAAFARIARFIDGQGAVPAIQLAHAGRKASHMRPWEDRKPLLPEAGGWEVVGPSPVPFAEGDLVPRELTVSDIGDVVEMFRHAAARALQAGFRLVEIHAAHGYLLHSFLSPISNRRTDRYGGSLVNRMRMLAEVVTGVRDLWPPDWPLFVRISSTDWDEAGFTLEEAVVVARHLKELGVDLIDCSSGGGSPDQRIPGHSGYQIPLAQTIRCQARIATGTVGLLSSPQLAEEIIANGRADLVILGRILLWNPHWPYHAASELGAEVDLPIQYARSGIYA